MNRSRILHVAALSALLTATACASGRHQAPEHSRPMPRQYAYPRPYEYAGEGRDTSAIGITYPLGATAEATEGPDGARWLTIAYPRWGASVHYTLTPVTEATRQAVIANRRQRMTLNAGATRTAQRDIVTPWLGALIVAMEPSPLPVQLLCGTDSAVLSAAAFMPGVTAQTPPDSIMPVINMLTDEVQHAITTLLP